MSIKEIKQDEISEQKLEDKTVKQLVRELIDRLPDDVNWEQLRYHMYVVESVYESLLEAKTSPGIPHEEVERIIDSWFE